MHLHVSVYLLKLSLESSSICEYNYPYRNEDNTQVIFKLVQGAKLFVQITCRNIYEQNKQYAFGTYVYVMTLKL